jgi:hypothetical protein
MLDKYSKSSNTWKTALEMYLTVKPFKFRKADHRSEEKLLFLISAIR